MFRRSSPLLSFSSFPWTPAAFFLTGAALCTRGWSLGPGRADAPGPGLWPAVVGGGLTGCEIAYELALQGKDVTIVEMKDDLVSQKGVCLANSSYLREWFAWKQVPVYLETTLREVKDGSIVCAAKDGSSVEIPCDTVISSAGYISTPLVEEKGHKNVQLVGDCLRVGNLRSVVWRAYEAAMKI